ncbi:MAG: hypothetical protein MZV63_17565 [Marinilabiliales bacterium]|nr:hypothetical protein [Marinilabiliales bacterium]
MKRLGLLLILCLSAAPLRAQSYPFQETGLDDEKRLDNLISLMTLEEKINCLSTRPSVPATGNKGHKDSRGSARACPERPCQLGGAGQGFISHHHLPPGHRPRPDVGSGAAPGGGSP